MTETSKKATTAVDQTVTQTDQNSNSVNLLAAAINTSKSGPAEIRKAFSAIADAQRPWGQLPSKIKQAARNDAHNVLMGKNGASDDLTKAGYSRNTARLLARDLGLAG